MKPARLIDEIRYYYEGASDDAQRFRYGLIVFDVSTILFLVVSSFMPRTLAIELIDSAIGIVILVDFVARFLIGGSRATKLLRPMDLVDIVVIVSFLAPVIGEGLGFLRVLRTLRLLRTYRTLARLRQDFGYFRRNEDVLVAAIHLFVFVFVMTGLVYETQHYTNPSIGNYADALYFTVTTLTTTGFGDITLPGTTGRLVSVAIMIFGVTLFLRLAQLLFRPNKVTYECQNCGLRRHDPDAVHCKHCGALIHIVTEGQG